VVGFPLEPLLTRDVHHFGVSTGSNGGSNTIESTIRGVTDNQSAMRVFIDLSDSGIGGGFLFESIALPQFGDLTDDC